MISFHLFARYALCFLCLLVTPALAAKAEETSSNGWKTAAPRDELRPHFAYREKAGHEGSDALIIEHDQREGLDGRWVKSFPIQGGAHYLFKAFRQATNLESPANSDERALARRL